MWKSQIYQDQWVAEVVFRGARGGYFLDIGAHDGLKWSNTYSLEKYFGWTGLLIEADPRYYQRISEHRSSTAVLACLDAVHRNVDFYQPQHQDGLGGIIASDTDSRPERMAVRQAEGKVHNILSMSTVTLHEVLINHNAPSVMDYLSIDIEGAEERVLGEFPHDLYKFKAITIERPKASLRKSLGSENYVEVARFKMDVFYVNSDYLDAESISVESGKFFAERLKQ